jgi:outer membrane murein-binding lipoprotein Lpp
VQYLSEQEERGKEVAALESELKAAKISAERANEELTRVKQDLSLVLVFIAWSDM